MTKAEDRVARGNDIWKRVVQNKDERFHYLMSIAAEFDSNTSGLNALLIDFKRILTIPTTTLYNQLSAAAKRRTVLTSPYVEHLSSRHAYFLSRVALPFDHHAPPQTQLGVPAGA